SLMWALDRVVIPVASAAVFIRIGYFITSDMIGQVTDAAFGVRFIQDEYTHRVTMQLTGRKTLYGAYDAIATNPQFQDLLQAVPYRHPAQLYEAFCYVFVFAILWYFYIKTNKGNQAGFLFGLFLVMLWTIRLFVEFVKGPQGEEYITLMG